MPIVREAGRAGPLVSQRLPVGPTSGGRAVASRAPSSRPAGGPRRGERDAARAGGGGIARGLLAAGMRIDYVELVHPETLRPVAGPSRGASLLVAAFVGTHPAHRQPGAAVSKRQEGRGAESDDGREGGGPQPARPLRLRHRGADRGRAGCCTGSEVKSLRPATPTSPTPTRQLRGERALAGQLPHRRVRQGRPASATPRCASGGCCCTGPRSTSSRGKVEQRGYTLVPMSLYFKDGWAKVELGLGRGKTHEDRRDDIAERESRREMDRALSRNRR